MKQRLYESYGYSVGVEATPEKYKQLNVPVSLQESVIHSYSDNNTLAAKAKKLCESTEVPDEMKSLLVEMATRLTEAESTPTFKIWKLPVARYNVKNLNGRIYPKALWENVRDNQRDNWCLLCGLNDHPKDEGLFRDQSVLWHDMEIGDDGIVYGYGSFVGDNGALAQQILEHGGRVGTSSSGFGEVDPYTSIVDPTTFEIDRLADLVLHPSQSTYGDASASVHDESKPYNYDKKPAAVAVNESVNQASTIDTNFVVDTTTAPQSAILKRINMEENTQSIAAPEEEVKSPVQEATQNFEELKLRKIVESYLNETNHMGSQRERIEHMQTAIDILKTGACADLREAVEEKIKAEKASLDEKIAKVENTERAFGMSIEEFTEKAAEGAKAQSVLQDAVTDYAAVVNALSKRNKSLKEEVASLKAENRRIRSQRVDEAHNSDAELAEARREIAKLRKANAILKESVQDLDDVNSQLREATTKIVNTRNEYSQKLREAAKIIQNGAQARKRLAEKNRGLNQEITELTENSKELALENKKLTEAHMGQQARFDQLSKEFTDYQAMIKDRYDESAHMAPSKNDAVRRYLDLREGKGEEIQMYWNRLLEQYGDDIVPYEQQILSSSTLREATNEFMCNIRPKIDENVGIGNTFNDMVPVRGVSDYSSLCNLDESFDPVKQYQNASVEERNQNFAELLKRAGE